LETQSVALQSHLPDVFLNGKQAKRPMYASRTGSVNEGSGHGSQTLTHVIDGDTWTLSRQGRRVSDLVEMPLTRASLFWGSRVRVIRRASSCLPPFVPRLSHSCGNSTRRAPSASASTSLSLLIVQPRWAASVYWIPAKSRKIVLSINAPAKLGSSALLWPYCCVA